MFNVNQRRITFGFLAAVFVTWILYLYREVIPSVQDLHESKAKLTSWISTSLSHEPANDHSWHSETESNELTSLCDRTHWTEGLWLQCHSYSGTNNIAIAGGLNNARNRIQTCIRLAIDAGASLILPPIATKRYDDHPLEFSNEEECLEGFWDINYLASELSRQCPQLKLKHCGDTTGIKTIIPSPQRSYQAEPYHTTTFNQMLTNTLREANIWTINPQEPVAVSFGDAYIAWNYTQSAELSTIQKSLFRILNFNPGLVSISNEILKSPELEGGFIAVHLRGESDWPAGFGTMDQQITLYIEAMEASQPTLPSPIKKIYVSSGSQTAIHSFAFKLQPLNYTIYDKYSLLADSPSILKKLDGMQFDQKAIVETRVLVGADYWYGVLMSTFSEMVAFKRTEGEKGNFFEEYILPGSERIPGGRRRWDQVPALRGNERTKLVVVNSGQDNLDCFP